MIAGFGLLFGSFLNVCIYRVPAGLSIVTPGSHCFSCGTPIRWFDNVPLVSYIILKGRCRWCGASFSPRYFFIELLTGILFGLTFYHFRYTLATPVYIVFICLLIVATFTDIDHWIIPDGVSLGGALFGLAAALLAGFFPKGFVLADVFPLYGQGIYAPFVNAICGAAFGAFLVYLIGVIGTFIFRKEAMGFGDVKLFLLIGAFLGMVNCVFVLMLGSIIGSVIGGGLLLIDKLTAEKPPASKNEKEEAGEESAPPSPPENKEERVLAMILGQGASEDINEQSPPSPPSVHHLPFGPYLAVAAVIVLFAGELLQRLLFGVMV